MTHINLQKTLKNGKYIYFNIIGVIVEHEFQQVNPGNFLQNIHDEIHTNVHSQEFEQHYFVPIKMQIHIIII